MGTRGSDIDHDRYAWCRHGSLWSHEDGEGGGYCSGPHYHLADGRCACRNVPQAERGIHLEHKPEAAEAP